MREAERRTMSEEKLLQYFSTLGHNVENKDVIQKCLELCEKHEISEEIFVDEWFSFVMTLERKGSKIVPAIENINKLDEYLKEKTDAEIDEEIENSEIEEEQVKVKTDLSRFAIFNASKKIDDDDEDGILGMYGVRKPVAATIIKEKEFGDGETSSHQDFTSPKTNRSYSPATYTPKTESPRYARGTIVSGKILQKIGKDVTSWKNDNIYQVKISPTDDPHVPNDVLYMCDQNMWHVGILQDTGRKFGEKLRENWMKVTAPDEIWTTPNVREKTQGTFRTYGRIVCEEEGKLNTVSTLLEGFIDPSSFEQDYHQNNDDDDEQFNGSIHLDLTRVEKYSIFPGQIICVECTNPTTDLLAVTKMLTAARPPRSSVPKIKKPIQLIIASGPFTLADTFDFQPLMKLMENVAENQPNILILIGPFIDERHTVIQQSGLVDTFQQVFENIIEEIMERVKGKCTQVVLVASCYDAHHHNVYPTPEYYLPETFSKYSNLIIMPDPCMLNIEGLIIGATSVDIIKHLGSEEISLNMQGMDRLGRLADHILSQSCFYPLYPPSSEVNLDIGLWGKYAMIHRQPHLLLLSSTMRHFCRWSNGCLILNPERLAKGTYARMNIRPAVNEKWLPNSVDCEILKI